MLRIDRLIKPWKEAGSLNAQINLYGFWNQETFLTKSGDVGMILRVRGVDYESLDHAARDYAVKRLESALKSFEPGFHIYQYLLKTNRPEIPFATYDDPLVGAAVEQRKQFFAERLDQLFDIEIYYAIVLEGARSKTGIVNALGQMFSDPAGGLHELKSQFAGSSMKVLLREQIQSDVNRLQQRVNSFARQLADLVECDLLNQQEQFRFFRRLLNFDSCRIAGNLRSTQFLDYQVANSDIEAERDHLRIGDHFARILTMKEAVSETRPLLLKRLLEIPANFFAVTEWVPIDIAAAKKEITKRKRHFNVSKSSFISAVHQDPAAHNARDVLIDESKQADIENLGDCLRAVGEGSSLGEMSFTLVIYDHDKKALEKAVPEFVHLFSAADGNLALETYNQLNAYFATVPGNYRQNLRRLYLLNSNYADLAFLFTLDAGDTRNTHLSAEYLAVVETEHQTPYFLNLHVRDVAHTLVLGATGSGKSVALNFFAQCAQKYRPLTFIFDMGGSFESLTHIFGGSYANVGRESRDFTINPFALAPTRENLQFLFLLLRVLIESASYKLDHREERQLYSAIERLYVLDPQQRTLSNFAEIVGGLKDHLHRWTRSGQYGFLFDNARDTLSFSRFQTFNFQGWNDASPEVMEALLFYVLHRASNEIEDPARLSIFKLFVIDEFSHFLRNATIRDYVIQAQKTWRKHNAAMVLATQSVTELAASGMLTSVAENCPTKIFLANPEMEPNLYREAFGLNDTELEILSQLVPPGQMLIRNRNGAKKIRLDLDPVSYWMATNNAKDNLLKRDYFRSYGIEQGLRRLAEDYPSLSNADGHSRDCTVTERIVNHVFPNPISQGVHV